jgi:hypothetical protein
MKPSTGWPFFISTQVGMLRMPKAAASCCSWSESILTSLKRPPYATSSFSSSGPITLHGPHQGAQKSTSTGMVVRGGDHLGFKVSTVTSIIGGQFGL